MKTASSISRIYWTIRLATVILIVAVVPIGPGHQMIARKPNILIYFDGHIHTTHSDGSGAVADVKRMALRRGLDAVIITNHCKDLTRQEWISLVAETTAASDDEFLVLPGFEVTGSEGIFNRDHILGWGVNDPFVGDDSRELCPEEVWESPLNSAGTGPMYPENLAKWVDYIHSKQGIAVHNHPSGTTRLEYGADSLEVYNQSQVDEVLSLATNLGYSPEQAWQLGMTYNNLVTYGERDVDMPIPFPGFPIPIPLRDGLWYATAYLLPPYIGQWLGLPQAPLSSWDELLLAYVNGTVDKPIFVLANSDAHNTADLNCSDSNGCSTVGVAKNGVYVRGFNANELFMALKAGRSFATTGPALDLDVNGVLMGDTAEIDDGYAKINLIVSSENPAAVIATIKIIKNGLPWQRFSSSTPTYQLSFADNHVTEDGYYRVEVTSYNPATGNYYFAWSNPVFIHVP